MTDLAARLAERARPSAEAPTMLPYLADRPADPRIAPESSLAEFGGFGDVDGFGDEVSLDLEVAPSPPGGGAGPELREVLSRASSGSGEAPKTPQGPDRPLSPVDVGVRRFEQHHSESHPSERIVERVHDAPASIRSTPGAPMRDGHIPVSVTTVYSEHSLEIHDPAPGRVVDSSPPTAISDPRDLPTALIPAREPAEALSRAPSPERPLEEETPLLSPKSTTLRPRERPIAWDEPSLPPEAPTIHIGNITVEVIQASPRAEARRVQAPQERPRRAAAATTSTTRASRPLRTFGLRQL